MEKRAVRVSFELWKQMMTQGYKSGGLHCIQGLPRDVEFLGSFIKTESLAPDDKGFYQVKTEPVFVFGSDNWGHPVSGQMVSITFGETLPTEDIIFQAAECRTCKQWNEAAFFHGDEGWRGCSKAPEQIRQKGDTVQAVSINDEGDWAALETAPSFGCTAYEPRETDD